MDLQTSLVGLWLIPCIVIACIMLYGGLMNFAAEGTLKEFFIDTMRAIFLSIFWPLFILAKTIKSYEEYSL